MKQSWTILAGVIATGAASYAQTNFPEVEANDSKATATAANCMVASDTITGNSISATTTGLDYFRVKTCALPAAIYRHRLQITTAGTAGHTGTIRGLTQTAGAPNAGTDATLQTTSTIVNGDLPNRTNQWYGFGRQEEVFYRVTGTASTTLDYVSTLSTTTVTPGVIAGLFNPGTITVSSAGSTTADTEIYLYDGALNPVALGHNDDLTGGIAGPSTVTVTLAAGTYYVAMSNYNTANNQGDLNPMEAFQTGTLLDFPDAVANSSTATTTNCSFTVTDGVTTTPVATTHANGFQVMWFSFTVGTPPLFAGFCAGDNIDPNVTTDCPCLNFGAAGRGCASSFNPTGAGLAATGSVALDTVVLNVDGVNASGNVIFMRGDVNNVVGVLFGDGVRCVDGVLRRRTKPIFAAGLASFPAPADTVTLSNGWGVGNDTPPGSGITAYYMAYYRNASAAFCPPETFNGTNAWGITW